MMETRAQVNTEWQTPCISYNYAPVGLMLLDMVDTTKSRY